MSLQTRLTLAAAAAVALAVAILAAGTYIATRNLLYGQVDEALRERADEAALRATAGGFVIRLAASPFGLGAGAQIVAADPEEPTPPFSVPVVPNDRRIASGEAPAGYRTAELGGMRLRVYVQQLAPGHAALLVRPLTEVDSTLSRLRLILILVVGVGVGGAALLGLLVARSALRPVKHLTSTAEEIARTADLSRRVEIHGTDELNRLAMTLNTMLDSLERSATAQKNLVADASHELRTPLTSIRTNVELLARAEEIAPDERERMVEDVVAQLEELTGLVGDLVELAREADQPDAIEDVRLDLLVGDAIERVRRRAPSRDFEVDASPTLVRGSPARLDRAVVNLLENAVAWGPEHQPIEVVVGDGAVSVRDHGPGFQAEDAGRLFDRFYRSARTRGQPGSGLGLAIVKQVAETHGGTATAERAEGGGARFTLALPADASFSGNTYADLREASAAPGFLEA
jgi:two-component system, OmpR family, sensor histidine kinase MprB